MVALLTSPLYSGVPWGGGGLVVPNMGQIPNTLKIKTLSTKKENGFK
jgi:hypothetical protein